MGFQTPKKQRPDRKDHIWHSLDQPEGRVYVCCTCGALCQRPPEYPTPEDWMPTRYVELSAALRGLVAFQGGRY